MNQLMASSSWCSVMEQNKLLQVGNWEKDGPKLERFGFCGYVVQACLKKLGLYPGLSPEMGRTCGGTT